MEKPIVQLWESVGLGLVVEYPSGVVYSNQTGGTANLQPEIEGDLSAIGARGQPRRSALLWARDRASQGKRLGSGEGETRTLRP